MAVPVRLLLTPMIRLIAKMPTPKCYRRATLDYRQGYLLLFVRVKTVESHQAIACTPILMRPIKSSVCLVKP